MDDLLQAGLTITAIGMGVVFALLILMVGVIRGMSALAIAVGGEPAPAGTPQGTAEPQNDDAVIPVIAAAIAAYRRHRES